jgi:hypothetical protein
MPVNNTLIPVDLTRINIHRLFGFGDHLCSGTTEKFLRQHGLLLLIRAYTAIFAAAVFCTLSSLQRLIDKDIGQSL